MKSNIILNLILPTVCILICILSCFTTKAIIELKLENKTLTKQISEMELKSKQNQLIPVTITAYNATKKQTDNTPHITATCSKVFVRGNFVGGRIAVSRDLYNVYKGDTIFVAIPFIVDDTMNKRFKNRVDLRLYSEIDAKAFGKKKGYIVTEWK